MSRARDGRLRTAATSRPAVWLMVAGSGAAAAAAGAHPTGTPVLDPVYVGVFGALVTAAGATAGRATVLWLAAVAAGFSRGYEIFPAAAGLVAAFAAALPRRPVRALGALAAALSVQVLLRWPHIGFQGGSALVAAAAVLPCLVHALARLPRRWRAAAIWAVVVAVALAVLFSVPVAVEALGARTQVSEGTTAAEGALAAVSSGHASTAEGSLRQADAYFSFAARRLGAWWTAGARLVPIAAQQRQALLTATQVAADVTATAAGEAGRVDFGGLHYAGGRIDLSAVEALQAPLARLSGQLTTGASRLAAVDSPWLAEPISSRLARLDNEVAKAQRSASLASQAVDTAPSLLGAGGTRRYLVGFMDPSESRGLGGLLVSYALVTADDGKLSIGPFEDISKLGSALAARGGGRITAPADFLSRYGQNPAKYPQNVTYSPDLPTVAEVTAQLYGEAGGGPIDGMMVVDPRAVAALLQFTGPISEPGLGTLTPSNAAAVLDEGQYADFPSASLQTARRAALAGALHQALARLASGSLPSPAALADALSPAVHQGDLLFWSTQRTDQAFLERIGMAGRFPSAGGGDLLGVVTSDSGADKMDAYLQKAVTDHVSFDPGTGSVTDSVQVVLSNRVPASGLPAEVLGSPPGVSHVWLTVYSSLRQEAATIDGRPVTLGPGHELGVNTYGAFLNIPPGSSETVTVTLRGKVAVAAGGGLPFSFYDQPMVLPARTTIEVTGPGGEAAPAWRPSGHSRAFHIFLLRRDF